MRLLFIKKFRMCCYSIRFRCFGSFITSSERRRSSEFEKSGKDKIAFCALVFFCRFLIGVGFKFNLTFKDCFFWRYFRRRFGMKWWFPGDLELSDESDADFLSPACCLNSIWHWFSRSSSTHSQYVFFLGKPFPTLWLTSMKLLLSEKGSSMINLKDLPGLFISITCFTSATFKSRGLMSYDCGRS